MIPSTRFSYIILLFLLSVPFMCYGQQNNEQLAKSTEVTLYKTPNCKCCTKWASYLEKNGFTVNVNPSDTLDAVKEHYLVPEELKSCHTAIIDGYVVEGHVPVESINKLLESEADAQGIAVPGMPTGTPGMGNDGTPYEVLIFDAKGDTSVYDEY